MSTKQPGPHRICVEMPNYIIRTIEPADANESWCKWLSDPSASRQLNASPADLSMDQLRAYIARFDSISRHLIGIFDKGTERLVGFRSIYVDHAKKEFLDNILIGEPDARGKSARSESTDAVLPFFFEELGMLSSVCGIVADNTHMLEVVARKGWVLERTSTVPAPNGGTRELHHFRLTREVWRERRAMLSPATPPRSGS